MKFYKIRNKKTGLFSSGGCYPRWSKTGKTWTTLGALKGHLAMFKEWALDPKWKKCLEDWEIVAFAAVEYACLDAMRVAKGEKGVLDA